MTTSTDIYDTIKANREKRMKLNKKIQGELSNSSLKKYTHSIHSLYKQLNINEPLTPIFFIKHIDKALDIIKNAKSLSTAHGYSVALFVYTNYQPYNTSMMEKLQEKQKTMMKRERTQKQKDNWITKKDIHKKLDDLEKQANKVYEKYNLGENLTDMDYQHIQDFILLLVSCDKYIPLRRSLDWCAFKIKNINLEEDNYITEDASALVFNS